MMDIKKELISRGMTEADFDSHESDLYVRVTPISEQFLKHEYEFAGNVERFVDAIDHVPWFDVPFANVAYWAEHVGAR